MTAPEPPPDDDYEERPSWISSNQSYIRTTLIGALIADIAIYSFVGSSLIAGLAVTGAVGFSVISTTFITRLHDRQVRQLMRAVADEPHEQYLRRQLIEKLATLPVEKILDAIRYVNSGGYTRAMCARELRSVQRPLEDRIERVLIRALGRQG